MSRLLRFALSSVILLLITLVPALAGPRIPLPAPVRATSELLTNGNFDTDADNNKIPDGWTGKKTTLANTDVRKCDKSAKFFARSAPCAFMFRGNPGGGTSKLQQTITDTSALVDGAEVTLSVYLDARSGTPGSKIGTATIQYSDGTATKLALTIPAAGRIGLRGVDDYQLLSASATLSVPDGVTITKAKVDFRYKGTKGKFLVDDASLTVASGAAGGAVKLIADDYSNGARFGNAVAISGDTAVVGAVYTDVNGIDLQGAAYVFVYNSLTDTWTQQAKLVASDGEKQSFFGWSVAISGDTILVGTPFHHIEENTYTGAVYVFTRSGTIWTETQSLIAADDLAGQFGGAVAIDGDTLAVGAIGGNPEGSVYVFGRDGATWVEQQKLVPSDIATGIGFGSSIALDGDTMAIGKPFDGPGEIGNRGAAYIFTRSGSTWTEQQKLLVSDGGIDDRFGWSIDLDNDSVVIGANWDAVGSNDQRGSAYIFTRSGATWTEQQKLEPSDGTADDKFFGESVTITGDTVVIGRPDYALYNDGAAYVFTRSGSVWTEQVILLPDDPGIGIAMGTSVALDADLTLITGAPFDDIGFVEANQGSAYVFELAPQEP